MKIRYFTQMLLLFFAFSGGALGQATIKTRPVFNEVTNVTFSDEWQYLTTDFYLFNESKFNDLINDLGSKPKTNWRGRLKTEKIESLSLTAKILNVKYYGNTDVLYPLYNFNVSYDKKTKYSTIISDELEVIRLIDNLPLAASDDAIDAKVIGDAITDTEGNKILRMVSDQLNNIAKFTDVSSAVLTVVGELGTFLESSASKTEYKFSSTIRLYDNTKFEKKVHSVNVYVMIPSTLTNDLAINLDRLQAFVNGINFEDDVDINKKILQELIEYQDYPFFVVVNYKSKYTPPTIADDQINSDYILSYEQRVNEDCKAGINSELVCNQERELIAFFKTFLDFKGNKEAYDLNYNKNINAEINKNLFGVLKDYRKLLYTKESRDELFVDIPAYVNNFSKRYDKLIGIANQYLNGSPALVEIKAIVTTAKFLRSIDLDTLDEEKLEKSLKILNNIELPDDESNKDEYKEIISLRALIEEALNTKIYKLLSEEIRSLDISNISIKRVEQIIDKCNSSNCQICRSDLEISYLEFQKKQEESEKKIAIEKTTKNVEDSNKELIVFLDNRDCIREAIDQRKEAGTVTAGMLHSIELTEKTFLKIDDMKELIDEGNITAMTVAEMSNYCDQIETIQIAITKEMSANCENLRAEGICSQCSSSN